MQCFFFVLFFNPSHVNAIMSCLSTGPDENIALKSIHQLDKQQVLTSQTDRVERVALEESIRQTASEAQRHRPQASM